MWTLRDPTPNILQRRVGKSLSLLVNHHIETSGPSPDMLRHMSDYARPRNDHQIWITRGHLAALAASTASIAFLAFLVGLQVGQRDDTTADEVATAPTLLPDADRDDALELLLREVELAQATVSPSGDAVPKGRDLAFPAILADGATKVPSATEPTVATVSVTPPVAAPPKAPNSTPPADGWAVQIASFPTVREADARISELADAGHSVYRVAALVDGQTWYRVRIGGFASRDRAESARHDLARRLEAPDLLLAEAP